MSTTYLILKYLMQNDYFDFRYIMNRVINSDLEKLEENLKRLNQFKLISILQLILKKYLLKS